MTETDARDDGGWDGVRPDAVFAALPLGALLLDADGRVLVINELAAALLGGSGGHAAAGDRCCELIGCGARGTRLEAGCLTRIVDRSGAPIAEFRVDLAPGSATGAAWVTARRLADGRIVAQVRAGSREDRRRAAVAAWSPQPRIAVRALGRTEVEIPGAGGGQAWVGQRAGQLLKLLVTERWRVVSPEEIADALWPDSPSGRTPTVRALVHGLRHRLDRDAEERAASCLGHREGGYRLSPERVDVDADAFESAARAGLGAVRRGRTESGREPLERAMALYRGHYLADEAYADWTIRERERLRGLAGEVARALVDIQVREGRLEPAAATARRLAEIDPFDADAQRRLVAVSLLRGRRSEAVRSYDVIREQMLRNFGEPPDFSLLDVADPADVWPGAGR